MPYLDSMLEAKHKANCTNPVGKRLYIRDYDNAGKQRFVSWGLTCTTCGVVIKEQYQRNLTPTELERKEWKIKLEGSNSDSNSNSKSEYAKTVEGLTGRPYHDDSWQESIERDRKHRIRDKLERLQRKRLGSEPMTPTESGLRTRIRNLKRYYEYQSSYWSVGDKKKIDFGWDNELVNEFLNGTSPRPSVRELLEVFASRSFLLSVDSQAPPGRQGLVPDPQRPGWAKYDKKAYIKILKSEAQKRMQMMRDIIKQRRRA